MGNPVVVDLLGIAYAVLVAFVQHLLAIPRERDAVGLTALPFQDEPCRRPVDHELGHLLLPFAHHLLHRLVGHHVTARHLVHGRFGHFLASTAALRFIGHRVLPNAY